jgi:putative ABC transport system permease protein
MILLRLAVLAARRRPSASLLVAAAVGAAAFTAQLGLAVSATAAAPWDRTFAATHGAHVMVRARGPIDVEEIRSAPGVAEVGAVRPVAFARLAARGLHYAVLAEGIATGSTRVDHPLVVAGTWDVEDGVVLERSFARVIGVQVGDRLAFIGEHRPITVTGIAVTATQGAFPETQPGVAFVSRAVARRLAAPGGPHDQILPLRLSNPAAAPAFAAMLMRDHALMAEPWQETRVAAMADSRRDRVVLLVFSGLMILAAGAVVVTLTNSRVLSELERLATMRALGFSPNAVAGLVAMEQTLVALAGAAVGLLLAGLAAPLVVARSAALLGSSPRRLPDVLALAAVVVPALLVALCAFLTARPVARRAVVAMRLAIRPRRGGRGAILQSPLPPAAAVGAHLTLARRGRLVSLCCSLLVTVATVVAALGMEATLRATPALAPLPPAIRGTVVVATSGDGDLRRLVYTLTLPLLALCLANVIATLLLTIAERRRGIGVLRATGFTPAQIAGGISFGYAIAAAGSALVALPAGVLLFRGAYSATNGSTLGLRDPSALTLAAVIPCAAAAVGLVALAAARRATRAAPALSLRQR